VKTERLEILKNLLLEQQRVFNNDFRGRTIPVLFDKLGRKSGQAIGRSPYLQAVHADNAEHFVGQIQDVKIEGVFPNSLKGALIDDQTRTHEIAC
jgi:tRNA-2-methylthio-N6-dimethylallyladenosine synthase